MGEKKSKGKWSRRGEPETPWGELKVKRVPLSVTQTAASLLRVIADRLGISRAEWLERVTRLWLYSAIAIASHPTLPGLILTECFHRGWTLERFAEEAGVSGAELRRICRGRYPGVERLEVLLAAIAPLLHTTEAELHQLTARTRPVGE